MKTRKEIKKIVYDSFFEVVSTEDLKDKIYSTSNDGENLLLYEELELDSLEVLEFMMYLEKNLNEKGMSYYDPKYIKIPDEVFHNGTTFAEIIDYIQQEMTRNI